MLTIFSIPKAFDGKMRIIQRNAIQSWLAIEPRCEILLCGEDEGVAETARELGTGWIRDIQSNEFGTPLVSSAFTAVQAVAANRLCCYVNADIILLPDLIDAIRLVPFEGFLLCGQRWNLDLDRPMDFTGAGWRQGLRQEVSARGEIQAPFGSDYFVFPRGVEWNPPRFPVGRPGWDNWIIYRARALRLPVVDATEAVTVIHQNHNYAHIPGSSDQSSFEGPEAERSRSLLGGTEYAFNLRDSTHQLRAGKITRAMDERCLGYRLQRQVILATQASIGERMLWRLLSGMFYRRQFFPTWFWQRAIYGLTR